MCLHGQYTKKFKQRKKRLVNVFTRAVYKEIQTKEKKLVNVFAFAVFSTRAADVTGVAGVACKAGVAGVAGFEGQAATSLLRLAKASMSIVDRSFGRCMKVCVALCKSVMREKIMQVTDCCIGSFPS